MKQWPVIVVAFLIVIGSALAADEMYHFNAYVFTTKPMQESKPAGDGEGSPEVCKHLFAPPGVYRGPYIVIGTNATVFGVVAVTDGKTTKVIPLFKWTDGEGKSHCGCNGPTPSYARQEDTEESLLKSIKEAIKQK